MTAKQKYKHLFFDLDHTLWDHDANSRDTLDELYGTFNLYNRGLHSKDEFIRSYQKINRTYWRKYRTKEVTKEQVRRLRFSDTLEQFNLKDAALAEDLSEAYLSICVRKQKVFPFAHEVLAYLKPRYQMHIITNGFKEAQHVKLDSANLSGYFTNVFISELVGHQKPHPAIFEFAVKTAQAQKSECLMLGDNLEADIRGSRDAGIDQVYFNPGEKMHSEPVTYEISCLSQLFELL